MPAVANPAAIKPAMTPHQKRATLLFEAGRAATKLRVSAEGSSSPEVDAGATSLTNLTIFLNRLGRGGEAAELLEELSDRAG